MASAWSASLNGGQRGPGSQPLVWWQLSPLKLKAFCPFSYKKWPKVKDLKENLLPCLRQTASCSHESTTSPKFWSLGRRPPGPPIAGYATDAAHLVSSHWPNPRVRVGVGLWLGSELGLGLGWGLGLGLGSGLCHALRHDALSTSESNNFVHIRRIGIRRNGAEPHSLGEAGEVSCYEEQKGNGHLLPLS